MRDCINMSYCRFQNTLKALRECDELFEADEGMIRELNIKEYRALKVLVSELGDIDLEYLREIIDDIDNSELEKDSF